MDNRHRKIKVPPPGFVAKTLPSAASGPGSRGGGTGLQDDRRPPQRGGGGKRAKKGGTDAEGGGDDDGGDGSDSEGESVETEHSIRMRKEHQHWEALQGGLQTVFVDSMPAVREVHALQHQGRMAAMQGIAAKQCAAQQEEHCAQCDRSGTWETGTQEVTYQGLESRGTLTLPTAKCCGCSTRVGSPSPQHALQLGCVASTPVCPAVYYDQRLMALYRRLCLMSGLSTSGAYAQLL
jgi:hypothetical protein